MCLTLRLDSWCDILGGESCPLKIQPCPSIGRPRVCTGMPQGQVTFVVPSLWAEVAGKNTQAMPSIWRNSFWGAEQDEALHHQVLGKAVLKIKKWQFSFEYMNIISHHHRTKIYIIAFCKVNDLEYSEVEFQYLQAPFLLSSENTFLCKPALPSMWVSPV